MIDGTNMILAEHLEGQYELYDQNYHAMHFATVFKGRIDIS